MNNLSPSISSSDHYHCLKSAWQLQKPSVFNRFSINTTFVFIYILSLTALPFVFFTNFDFLDIPKNYFTSHFTFQAQLFGTKMQLNQLCRLTNWALINETTMIVKIPGSIKPPVYYFVYNYSECISLPDSIFPGTRLNPAKGLRGKRPELRIRLNSRDASSKRPQFRYFFTKHGFLGHDPWPCGPLAFEIHPPPPRWGIWNKTRGPNY